MAPFDLDHLPDMRWSDDLRPVGEATSNKEAFAHWWQRNRDLHHLPEDLCEQWIYRHWVNSPFSFIPLDTLHWQRAAWSDERVLSSIYRAWGGELQPQFDHNAFQRRGSDDRLQTAMRWMLVLGTIQWSSSPRPMA